MNKKHLTYIVFTLILSATLFNFKTKAAEPSAMVYENRFILLDKYTGYGGDTIYVRGYGYYPNETVQIYFKDDKDDPGTYVTTNEYGNFNSTMKNVPEWKAKKYKVYAYGETSNNRESADFYIRGYSPWARPTKYYVHVGESVGYRGFGFKPNSEINLYFKGDLIHTFVSDDNGNFEEHDVLEIIPDWEDDDLKQYFVEPTTGKKIKFKLTVAKEYN